MTTTHVHVFDFDGVLARPYTHPELLFPGAERLLRTLSATKDHIVLIASFNPRAYHILEPLLTEGIIHGIRAGSNGVEWWKPEHGGAYVDAKHREQLSKAAMIEDLLEKHGQVDKDTAIVRFFDDDEANIADVCSKLPDVHCFHVSDWSKGLMPHYQHWFPTLFSK